MVLNYLECTGRIISFELWCSCMQANNKLQLLCMWHSRRYHPGCTLRKSLFFYRYIVRGQRAHKCARSVVQKRYVGYLSGLSLPSKLFPLV